MEINLARSEKRAIKSLYGDETFSPPDVSFEKIPVTISVLDEIIQPEASITGPTRQWQPVSLTDWIIRAAVGQAFQVPTAGAFTLTLLGDTTPALAFDVTVAQIETALNLLAAVNTAGGVTVSGEDGYFYITFNNVGARTLISGDATGLAPESQIEPGTLVTGDATHRAVMSIRILQTPAAYGVISTVPAAPDVAVSVVQVGGAGLNHKVRINLTQSPYDGQWTLVVGANETAFLGYNITAADLTAAVEAIASVGTGNVEVIKEQAFQYLIQFIGAHADENMGTIGKSSALQAVDFRSGFVDTRTAAMELFLNGREQADAFFEIEGTPPGGSPQKLWKWPVKIIAPVINGNYVGRTVLEFYTKEEADARFAKKTIATGYRIKDDGAVQLWNPDQSLFQRLTLSGAAGAEVINILAGEA